MLATPKLVIAVLILAMIGLVWALQKAEREEQREVLIGDVLWLEQNMRFQLSNSSDKLTAYATALSDSIGSEADSLPPHATSLIKQHPEVIQVVHLDARGRIVDAVPSQIYPRAAGDEISSAPLGEWLNKARLLGRPVVTPFFYIGSEKTFEIIVPVFRGSDYLGAVLAVYSLRKLFDDFVPWWFAEKYRLQLIDPDDETTVISKSNVKGSTLVSYDLPVDRFSKPLLLRASAVKLAFNPILRSFAIAIVVLALVILASLWGIRRQLQKRLTAEQALRASNAFRKAMEDSLLTGLRARDLSGKLIYANPAFCKMVGYSVDELIGLNAPMPYWAPEDMEATMRLHEEVMRGNAPPEGYEIRLKRKTGEVFEALVYEAPLIDGEGQHVGWMGSVLDVTERKRHAEFQRLQQEQMQHTARLIALGEMASSLAHELNQPLAAISSYAAGCLSRIENQRAAPGELAQILGKISTQSQRAGRIIRQVHDFVRKREPRLERTSVAEIVDEAVALFEPQARKAGLRITRTIQGGLPDVLADPTMIEQVLINLLRNAADAVAEGPEDAKKIEISVSAKGSSIEVRLSDHGPGIPSDRIDQLFTPFFTTKAEGLGMGLPICRSIIEFHHGRLSVDSQPGLGASFVFTLPIEPLAIQEAT